MLKELRLSQHNDSPTTYKRWFQDEYFDLFIWEENRTQEVIGFQLCYDRLGKERVLSWDQCRGFGHHRIDDGEHSPHKNMTPVFVVGGNFASDEVLSRFSKESIQIDENIKQFIMQKLIEYIQKRMKN